jgi:hypothetical protein
MIRDRILDSKKFNRVSEPAQVFFFRLMLAADDYGYYLRDPELIKAYLYPRMPMKSVEQISDHLRECFASLDDSGVPLVIDHSNYLEIPNFNQRLRLKKNSKYKNDGHVSDTCLSYDGLKGRTNPSLHFSSLEIKGGVGGEEGVDDEKPTPEEITNFTKQTLDDLKKRETPKTKGLP